MFLYTNFIRERQSGTLPRHKGKNGASHWVVRPNALVTATLAGNRHTAYPSRQQHENSTGTRLRGGKNNAKVENRSLEQVPKFDRSPVATRHNRLQYLLLKRLRIGKGQLFADRLEFVQQVNQDLHP